MAHKTTEIAANPYPSILLVGDSGTHKSWFLGTCPKPYIFDFDKGMAILRGVVGVEYDSFKDASYGATVTATMKEEGIYPWGTAWDAFLKRINEIGKEMDQGKNEYKTLCLDSLTTLSDICMSYVLKNDGKTPKDVVAVQHYGMQIRLLQKVMEDLISWPIIKVVTAHVQRNQNDLTQVTEMLPLVTGKLAGKVGLYFDEVYYTGAKKDANGAHKFTVTSNTSGLMKQAKSRYGVPDGTETSWKAIEPYVLGTKK